MKTFNEICQKKDAIWGQTSCLLKNMSTIDSEISFKSSSTTGWYEQNFVKGTFYVESVRTISEFSLGHKPEVNKLKKKKLLTVLFSERGFTGADLSN